MSNVSKLGVRPKVEDPSSRPTLVADENSNHPIYNNANNANIGMQANRLSEMTEENDAFYVETAFDFEKGPVGKTEKFCEKTEQIQDLLANQWSKVCTLATF